MTSLSPAAKLLPEGAVYKTLSLNRLSTIFMETPLRSKTDDVLFRISIQLSPLSSLWPATSFITSPLYLGESFLLPLFSFSPLPPSQPDPIRRRDNRLNIIILYFFILQVIYRVRLGRKDTFLSFSLCRIS